MPTKAYQFESEANGDLAMACQKAAPYVAAARAMSTRRLYASAFCALGAVVQERACVCVTSRTRDHRRLPR